MNNYCFTLFVKVIYKLHSTTWISGVIIILDFGGLTVFDGRRQCKPNITSSFNKEWNMWVSKVSLPNDFSRFNWTSVCKLIFSFCELTTSLLLLFKTSDLTIYRTVQPRLIEANSQFFFPSSSFLLKTSKQKFSKYQKTIQRWKSGLLNKSEKWMSIRSSYKMRRFRENTKKKNIARPSKYIYIYI